VYKKSFFSGLINHSNISGKNIPNIFKILFFYVYRNSAAGKNPTNRGFTALEKSTEVLLMRQIKFTALTVTFLTAVFLSSALLADNSFLKDAYSPSPLKKENENSVVHQLQDTYHKIYRQYNDSVVFISTEKTVKARYNNPFSNDPFFRQFFGRQKKAPKTRKLRGLGTGFLISKDGYICTNSHVVEKMDNITVKVNDKEYKAKVVGSDKMTDIALIKIQGGNDFKPVHFGNSDNAKIGDFVLAIGNPFGLDKTYTSGIVSAVGRKRVDTMGNSHIQTDASINQGNSGGPLINIDGEVIGVNRAIYSNSGGSVGIGFAIPINMVKGTLVELKKFGKVKRGFIGVQIAPLTKEFAKELGLKKTNGALVGSVVNNGPAFKAGIREKDVIIAINNKTITDFHDLIKIVSKVRIGKTMKVTVWRDKQKTNFWVTARERP